MAPNAEILSNVSDIKQQVDESPRGTKRSYVDQFSEYGPSCPKTPKLEIEDSLSESHSGSEDQSSGSRSVPKEEQEDTLAELVMPTTCYEPALYSLPAQKRRGRPPGVKNRPKEMRIVKTVSPTHKKRTYTEKTVFHYPMIITMALMNSPEERATCTMMYDFAVYHFPSITANTSWKNTLRHALSSPAGFQKEKFCGRSSFWYIMPERRDELIQSVIETAEEYKENPGAYMMRNVDELPAILAGKSRLPQAAIVHAVNVVDERPKPASDSEFDEILKIKPVSLKIVEKPSVPVSKSIEEPEVEIIKEVSPTVAEKPLYLIAKPRAQVELQKQKPTPRVVAGSPFRYITREPAAPRGYWVPLADPSNPSYSNPWQKAHHPFVYGGPQSGYGMEM